MVLTIAIKLNSIKADLRVLITLAIFINAYRQIIETYDKFSTDNAEILDIVAKKVSQSVKSVAIGYH